MVHNNLFHGDINYWLPMIHPAQAPEKYLYSSSLTAGWYNTLSIWGKTFGHSTQSLRICSIFYFTFFLFALKKTSSFLGDKYFLSGWLILLAPKMVLFSVSISNWVPSSLFVFFYLLFIFKESKKSLYHFLFGIITILFNIKTLVWMVLFFTVLLCHDRFFKKNNISLFPGLKVCISYFSGGIFILSICLLQRNLIEFDHMSVIDYIFLRGGDRVGSPNLSTYFFAINRLYSFISINYPLFIVICGAIGLFLFSNHKTKAQNKTEYYIAALGLSHFIYLVILSKTTIHHDYTLYTLLWIGSLFAGTIFTNRLPHIKPKASLLIISILSLLTLYEYRRTEFWIKQDDSITNFLSSMDSKQFLLRDEHFNPWPLHLNNPEKTLHISPKDSLSEVFSSDKREIKHYTYTFNTIYYLDKEYNNLTRQIIPVNQELFYITTSDLDLPLITKDKKYRIYQLLK